jgi:fucose 4-O-acetylase-like acetyltransferase
MASEKRTIFLACVTLTVYAFSGLLQQGKFLYPFPLNEFIFLGIASYISIRNFASQKINYSLLIVSALFYVACRSYNWNLLLDTETSVWLDESYLNEICYLLFYTTLCTLTFRLSERINQAKQLGKYIGSILLIILGSIFDIDSICLLGILLQVNLFYTKETNSTTPFVYLYFFLAFLIVTKELTLFLA